MTAIASLFGRRFLNLWTGIALSVVVFGAVAAGQEPGAAGPAAARTGAPATARKKPGAAAVLPEPRTAKGRPDAAVESQEPGTSEGDSQRWAVILVGLPGDAEHETTFRETADRLQTWLIQSLGYPADRVVRVPAAAVEGKVPGPATAEQMREGLAGVAGKVQPADSLWVLVLGHGNYDGRRGWLHVAGRDPSGDDFKRWLENVRCREQVVWLTQSSSGWFVKPLARPGRIVIAATATDDESNETEFPHALASVAGRPLTELDLDQDKSVSVAELYTATVAEVLKRFQADNRLPTEHPQIDDNGDGVGTEQIESAAAEGPAPPGQPKRDGGLASRTRIPYRFPSATAPESRDSP